MKGETKQNKGINIDSKELVIALNEYPLSLPYLIMSLKAFTVLL